MTHNLQSIRRYQGYATKSVVLIVKGKQNKTKLKHLEVVSVY